jgi:hypothetical protein
MMFSKMKSTILIALACAAAATCSPTAFAANCVAGTWQSPPDQSIFDAHNRAFPVRAESQHFQLRWPANKPNHLTAAQAQEALRKLESLWSWYTSPPVNWVEPFCDSAQKIKAQIFTDDGYGFSGSGAGQRTLAMWVHKDALLHGTGVLAHEFTHTLQFASEGLRQSAYSGWVWESHANFMAESFPENRASAGCNSDHAWMPHIYYGSTRNRYCNGQFWEYVKNTYGFGAVNGMFTSTRNILGQDPLESMKKNMGWSDAQFNDVFGTYAMRNVNWDYIAPDGFNKGAVFRNAFGPNTDVSGDVAKRLRLARLEPIDKARGRYVVSNYWAPQRFGYNIVRLIPKPGAASIQVAFRGVVQDQIAPGAQLGGVVFEPGNNGDAAWRDAKVSAPNSDWRWGVVAIDANGKSRYSPLQRGARADINFALSPGDREVYMVVTATPSKYQKIFWDQKYNSLYRYPWKVQLTNATPDGQQDGYNPGFPPGRRHANGGGWVANGAQVDASAYVGPNAAVLGGEVRGNARVEDYAIIWNGRVLDNAIVGGLTQFNRNLTASDRAEIRLIRASAQTFNDGTMFTGNVKLFGDLESHLGRNTLSRGVFTGFLTLDEAMKAEWGANLTKLPVEVTAPVPPGWPDPEVQVIRPLADLNAAVAHAYSLFGTDGASTARVLSDQNFQLIKRPGLAGKCASFEAVNWPGYYLRHAGYRIRLAQNDGSDLMKQDATFCERERKTGSAWESVNYPGHFWYLNAQKELWIARFDGASDFELRTSFLMGDSDVPVVQMKLGGLCPTVDAWSQEANRVVILWHCNQGPNTWQLSRHTENYYEVKATHSGKCLDVLQESTAAGAGIVQNTCRRAAWSQQWKLDVKYDGSVTLTNRYTNQNLTAANSAWMNWSPATHLTQQNPADTLNQWFGLTPSK